MHTLCMPTKTISLRLEAYEKLRRARRYGGESFSEVVLRARWPEESTTGAALLARYREHGAYFTEDDLARLEDLKRQDREPEDKWVGR